VNPVRDSETTAASGPTAFATSLAPWANATKHAVAIWSSANIRST